MKKLVLLIMIIFSILNSQCSNLKKSTANGCKENIEFKDAFILNINKVENYTLQKEFNKKEFNDGIEFLSKYCHVSEEELMNYANEYTNSTVFYKDKEGWLKWYNENKCRNIQFK
ncbi:hypothetical protein ACHRVZ_19595 [Flavobacterium sp. FlaQc-57]|uniref:hypothetical protein n=1 Tax=Flavobacterium sp. FlaQc-57 TaxID=3374186 RepID=UPI0037578849